MTALTNPKKSRFAATEFSIEIVKPAAAVPVKSTPVASGTKPEEHSKEMMSSLNGRS